MKPFYILLASALLSAATTSAQTTFRLGPRGGIQLASTTVASSGTSASSYFAYSSEKSIIIAWQAGVVGEINFGKLAIQPALVFSQKGEKLHTIVGIEGVAYTSTSETTSITRYNWLELPLNVVYTPHRDHGLQFFAGPYLAQAVGGHRAAATTGTGLPAPSITSSTISYSADSPNRSFDAGANFGIGYRQGPLQIQLGYQLGMYNLHRKDTSERDNRIDYIHNFEEDAAYNRMIQLTGTYFFSL